MSFSLLPFEKPLESLFDAMDGGTGNRGAIEAEIRERMGTLSAMQKVQLARHAGRPTALDYITRLITDWTELKGDRRFADDAAIVAGLGRFGGRPVAIVAQQKGRTTKDNVRRNFGMAHPEGYRKASRIYDLANRFMLPVITLVDTPGAYPGIGAEERGQSEAIGSALMEMAKLRVPVVTAIIGEGGSGGALALAVANHVMVLEYGCYSVISPEGCASILWKDAGRSADAAERLKLTAPDLLSLGIVDEILEEPLGGAHRNTEAMTRLLGERIGKALDALSALSPAACKEHRYARFRKLGVFRDVSA